MNDVGISIIALLTALLVACASDLPAYAPGECTPQIEPGDGSATVRVRVETSGEVSEVELLEASTEAGFGALAVQRAQTSIYPKREDTSDQIYSEKFRNIRTQDRIVLIETVSVEESEFTEADFETASRDGNLLWACGTFEATVRVLSVLCARGIDPSFIVHGSLDHSSCASGVSQSGKYLVWARPYSDGWWVQGAYPVFPTTDGDFAITAWDAQNLFLDRLEREVPELPDAAPPYFVTEEFDLNRENLDLYRASPRYLLRGTAVLPRTGVLLAHARLALQGKDVEARRPTRR